MSNANIQNRFEHSSVPKAVFTLAAPTIMSSLVMILYNLADTYFVGLLNDPVQNAAVTLCAPLLLAFNAVNNLFGIGASSMISRAIGARDMETAKKSAAVGFYGALLSSLLFTLVCVIFKSSLLSLIGANAETAHQTSLYMRWAVTCGAVPSIVSVVLSYLVRAEGATLHASIGVSSGCLLNIILDPIFALPWGLGLGAEGVGLATFLSNSAVCLYFIVYILCRKGHTCISISPRDARPEKRIVFGILAVGVSASVQNLLNVTGSTILNNFAAAYGSAAVASIGIATKIQFIPVYVLLGISQGVSPLVGYNYAKGDYPYMKKVVNFTVKLTLIISGCAALVFVIFAPNLTGMFIENADIVSKSAVLLRGFALSLPFMCIDYLSVGVFQAVGMGKKSFVFAILRKIVFEIPALLILNSTVGLFGLPFGQVIAEFVLCITALVILSRLFARLIRHK